MDNIDLDLQNKFRCLFEGWLTAEEIYERGENETRTN